jgi:hypothetical protein
MKSQIPVSTGVSRFFPVFYQQTAAIVLQRGGLHPVSKNHWVKICYLLTSTSEIPSSLRERHIHKVSWFA